MEKIIKDIENGKDVYLKCANRFKYATIRKVGSTMGFPVYLVEEYMHGLRNYNWAFKDLDKAIETLKKGHFKFD